MTITAYTTRNYRILAKKREALETVKQDGYALNYVPVKFRTIEICMEAVKQNGYALLYVPEENITAAVCYEAFKQNTCMLRYIPEEFITVQMCLDAFKSRSYDGMFFEEDSYAGYIFNYVPEKFKSMEIYHEAVKSKGNILKRLPKEVKTPQMCLDAVKREGKMLWYVPAEFKTMELCLEAVTQDGIALNSVPDKFKTAKMCLEAVKSNGKALKFVPENLKTYELCREAVNQNIFASEYVPHEFTEEISKHIFFFEDIVSIDDNSIQKILRETDSQILAKVLKNSDTKVQNKIFRNMLHQEVSLLKEEIEYTGTWQKDIEEAQSKISLIILKLENTGEIVVHRSHEKKITSLPFNVPVTKGSVDTIVDTFKHADIVSKQKIFDMLNDENPELSNKIKKLAFEFKDITILDDRSFQMFLREVDYPELAIALKGLDMSVYSKIFVNLSRQGSAELIKALENIESIKPEEIKEVRQKFVSIILHLEEIGEIRIGYCVDSFSYYSEMNFVYTEKEKNNESMSKEEAEIRKKLRICNSTL